MINIYDYQNADKLVVTDLNGIEYAGELISVNDVEDEDEDFGLKEDSISIAVNQKPITFTISQIKKIRIIQ